MKANIRRCSSELKCSKVVLSAEGNESLGRIRAYTAVCTLSRTGPFLLHPEGHARQQLAPPINTFHFGRGLSLYSLWWGSPTSTVQVLRVGFLAENLFGQVPKIVVILSLCFSTPGIFSLGAYCCLYARKYTKTNRLEKRVTYTAVVPAFRRTAG